MECQLCGYNYEYTEYEECPQCNTTSGVNYLKLSENQLTESRFSLFKKDNIRRKIEYLKFFKKIDIINIPNLRISTFRLSTFSNLVALNLINNVVDTIDEGFDKIRINVDEGFDKAIYKIMTNVDAYMKTIVETSNDPNVKIVAKVLSRHSPKIALLIASYALAGIPYGTLITQVAGLIINQIGNSEQSSPNNIGNTLNIDTISPILENLLTKSFCQSTDTQDLEIDEEKRDIQNEESSSKLFGQLESITERLRKLENEKQLQI